MGSRGSEVKPTVISKQENYVISNNNNFCQLFYHSENCQLRFSLLNLLESKDQNDKKHTYPFLEYYVDFGSKSASNKYYKIEAE
jgi:hypothetical protein